MNNKKYTMSFTTGGLFRSESVKLAKLFVDLNDWEEVRDRMTSENLLQTRTFSTSKRIGREIVSRLKTLSTEELDLLTSISPQEQGYLLWIATCRRYQFIADFAIEVLREKYLSLKTDLNYDDYESFFNQKSEWHPELEEISTATRSKLRQVLFKILREADLLTDKNTINAVIPGCQLFEIIANGDRRELSLFPMVEPVT